MEPNRHIVISLDPAFAFDRRAFDGIATLANERENVRLVRRLVRTPLREVFSQRDVNGVITSRADEADLADLHAAGVPFVNLADNRPAATDSHYVVAMDEEAIGRMAARHFLDAGFARFVVIARPNVRNYFGRRIGSFREAVGEAGYECPVGPPERPAHAPTGMPDQHVWDTEVDVYLKELGTPLAVFAPFDYYGQVAINAARSIGLRVPDDVAVLGVDDDEVYCMTASPRLSSVVTPGRQIGERAMSLLLDVLDGKPRLPRRTLVQPPDIIVRGSSGERAMHDPDVLDSVSFIRSHIGRSLTVKEVAGHVHLSRRTLERRFLTTLGHTVADEVRRCRVRYAKSLLTDTNLSFIDIARRVGFGYPQQLIRLMKTATGMTPLQYRHAVRSHR